MWYVLYVLCIHVICTLCGMYSCDMYFMWYVLYVVCTLCGMYFMWHVLMCGMYSCDMYSCGIYYMWYVLYVVCKLKQKNKQIT